MLCHDMLSCDMLDFVIYLVLQLVGGGSHKQILGHEAMNAGTWTFECFKTERKGHQNFVTKSVTQYNLIHFTD